MKYGADALLPQNQKAFNIILLGKILVKNVILILFLTKKEVDSRKHQEYELKSHRLDIDRIHDNFLSKTIGHSF